MGYEDKFKAACIKAILDITDYLNNTDINSTNITQIVNTILEGQKLMSVIKKL